MAVEKYPLNVDLDETMYDFLGLPEGDENMMLYIRYMALVLNREVNNELSIIDPKEQEIKFHKLELLRDRHIPGLVDEAYKAKKSQDVSNMLSSYSLIDIARKKEQLKVLERNNSLSNKTLNDIINDRMRIWTRMYKTEDRTEYDAALLEKRKAYVEYSMKVSSKDTLYSFLTVPELPSELLKSIEGINAKLKEIESGNINDPEIQELLKGKNNKYGEDRATLFTTLKEVAPVLIERLEEIINDYYRSGSDEELLKGYSGVNIILKKVLLDNEVANGKLTQDSAADLMKKYNHAWAILTNPELKKTYDLKLARVRRRDAIKNKIERNKQTRKDLVEDELRQSGDIYSYDQSRLKGGEREKGRLDGLPVYQWTIKEYPKGKQLIMSTNSVFLGNPELNEKVEVYAHGEFLWGTMTRRDENGKITPTITDSLCEVISVRKVDKYGNESVTYGIAQTRERRGYLDRLTKSEIDQLTRDGFTCAVPKEIADRRNSIQDVTRRRVRREAYEITRVRKPTSFGEKLIKFNRFLDKIGLEIPDYMIPNEIIEQRRPVTRRPERARDELDFSVSDSRKKHTVFVFNPIRNKISIASQADIARVVLSDYVFDKFKEGNGHFIGVLAENQHPMSSIGIEETIKACQYASKYPDVNNNMRNLNDAFEYLERRDKRREKEVEKPSTKRFSDTIDFYGE